MQMEAAQERNNIQSERQKLNKETAEERRKLQVERNQLEMEKKSFAEPEPQTHSPGAVQDHTGYNSDNQRVEVSATDE
ncbi:hypothetical protein EJ04DRAFT_512949 [Polyplosphaeria fusca]|uniref:Uncharacterized protein n=1 Tax=Polyplosphaeria fusca TaxID=682080 RepID=A0A9P4V258_9PLEO|nr:hypothetical protein EJ04DRAFT_512949 [Polyplosphaeria fusca]